MASKKHPTARIRDCLHNKQKLFKQCEVKIIFTYQFGLCTLRWSRHRHDGEPKCFVAKCQHFCTKSQYKMNNGHHSVDIDVFRTLKQREVRVIGERESPRVLLTGKKGSGPEPIPIGLN